MKKILIIIFVVSAFVIVSGCTGQNAPITEITIPGHGQQIYQFSYDIRESQAITSDDPLLISLAAANADNINIVFDASSSKDNSYFQVIIINIIQKITTYYSYEGKVFVDFPVYYYIDVNGTRTWYNKTNEEIQKPDLNETTLWLLGPSTGASETSVTLDGNIIYIQGTSYKNLTLAGDKFALIVMGIKEV
jgi:hypothetical protein